MQGWIKLHRKIRECDMWNSNEPFDRRSAWIDLLLMANHEERKVMFGNAIILVPAGSFITSETKLSQRWRWSRHRVDDYLKLLVFDAKIGLKKDSQKTTISIENWAKYQTDDTSEGQQKDSERTSKGHQKDTNKNDKNYKNTNVPPIIPQLEQLHPEVQAAFADFIADRKERKEPMTSRAITLNANKLSALSSDKNVQIAIIKQSIERGWKGLFEIKDERKPRGGRANHSQRVYSAAELDKIGVDLLEDV